MQRLKVLIHIFRQKFSSPQVIFLTPFEGHTSMEASWPESAQIVAVSFFTL